MKSDNGISNLLKYALDLYDVDKQDQDEPIFNDYDIPDYYKPLFSVAESLSIDNNFLSFEEAAKQWMLENSSDVLKHKGKILAIHYEHGIVAISDNIDDAVNMVPIEFIEEVYFDKIGA